MRKINKIILVLIITFVLINVFGVVFAKVNPDDYNPSSLTDDDTKLAFAKTQMILGAIRNISIVVSVITLMIIGLKYIIGCILAVSGTTLVSFIYNAFNK